MTVRNDLLARIIIEVHHANCIIIMTTRQSNYHFCYTCIEAVDC